MHAISTLLALALTMLAMPSAVQAQAGEGRCTRDRNRPNDETLYCVWGQGVAIFPCQGGTECTEDGSACYRAQSCEGCAWYVHCE